MGRSMPHNDTILYEQVAFDAKTTTEEAKKTNHVLSKLEKRTQNQVLDPHIE
ncbi:unnamed protein product [Lupinus luteus]|uniref:Uncharacterized protein n=1 Tax=Lupinus luteus TaxID=3873 RepID=A0AAV1XPU1_LUPLU